MNSSSAFRAVLPHLGVLTVETDGATTLGGIPLSRSEVFDVAQAFARASALNRTRPRAAHPPA